MAQTLKHGFFTGQVAVANNEFQMLESAVAEVNHCLSAPVQLDDRRILEVDIKDPGLTFDVDAYSGQPTLLCLARGAGELCETWGKIRRLLLPGSWMYVPVGMTFRVTSGRKTTAVPLRFLAFNVTTSKEGSL